MPPAPLKAQNPGTEGYPAGPLRAVLNEPSSAPVLPVYVLAVAAAATLVLPNAYLPAPTARAGRHSDKPIGS